MMSRTGEAGRRQRTCKMPDVKKFGSPIAKNRLAETAIVILVVLAAAVAYWFSR